MDKELLEATKKYGTNDWGAGTPSHRTGLVGTHSLTYTVENAMSISVSRNQVRERYGVLLPSTKKGPWTPEEDAKLVAALGDADPLKVPWLRIAKGVSGRNGKQCRDRCVRV
jgi:Myb-like DNA-binding domain